MKNKLKVTIPDDVPRVDYEREFDFPAAAVFRAHTDPELFKQWIGPQGLTTRTDAHDCRTGGSYRFVQWRDDGPEYAFRGVFHTVRENEFILQTFEFEGYPDVVTLEFTRFEDLPDGRCKLSGHSVFPTKESLEKFMSDGMEYGMTEGYERLEDVLAQEGN